MDKLYIIKETGDERYKIMYILLDVDGVLNTKSDWKQIGKLNNTCVVEFCNWAVKYEAKIILTSSWRLGFISSGNVKNSPQIQELEKMLSKYSLSITGILRYNDNRGKAIIDFQGKYKDSIVLDDDISEMGIYRGKIQNLYIINAETGFTKNDAKKVNKLLKP